MEMLTAFNFEQAKKAIISATEQAKDEMPNGTFVLTSIDNEYIYFNVVCKLEKTNKQEIKDIKEKTRFHTIKESLNSIYIGEFKMNL